MVAPLAAVKSIVDPNAREIARYRRRAEEITALEPQMQALSDEELAAKTVEFRRRLAQGEDLEDMLHETFAVCREAARRVLGERHYDVQLIGGMILHDGKIAEMKTGEGKTLTATLALYANALPGRGAHLVTTNDFLVRWQAQWMGQVFEFLGLTVGYIQHTMNDNERRAMYARDITYVENSELGFDYLRDNMTVNPAYLRQRELYYAIVDEADSILIDEARTPLIISGETEQEAQNYRRADELVRKLLRADNEDEPLYTWDKKDHQAALTEAGQEFVERELHLEGSLVDPENIEIAQLVDNALKAHKLYDRDDEYVVMNGEVVIVDEFTGHLQPGRRYSDGLHQAIEAKERVFAPRVRQTVASITYQNFFKLYKKLAGMTGTAKTEEQEFTKTYGCRVTQVPTNRPVIRKDYPDTVFKSAEAKCRGIINEIINCHLRDQPVLVGTRSVDVSEHLASRLEHTWLQTHILVQVLLHRIRTAGKELGKDDREAYLRALRQPIGELVDQARHLKRRSAAAPAAKGRKRGKSADDQPQVTLGDIVAALSIPEDLQDTANLDAFLEVIGLADNTDSGATREIFRQRLAALIANGLKPGDENHESKLNVLNAKRHEQEGTIIARAGEPGMVTIATNMAGRGVDIILGGRNPAKGQNYFPERYEYVKACGGLHVIGTERHESRRIDDQLRGRSGRQGDPGSSRFYVSLEDELMQLFGPDRFGAFLNSWPDEEAIETRMVSRAIERAQEKVETRNFGMRKHTLEYDNVMNRQRSVVYAQRRRVLDGENVQSVILRMIDATAENILDTYANRARNSEDWDLEGLYRELVRVFSTPPDDEAKRRARQRATGSGIAVALAVRDLEAMAQSGESMAGYLREKAIPHGSLRRNVDQDTAREMLDDEVNRTVGKLLAEHCPADQAKSSWRLADVVRGLEEEYEGVAQDLGHEGLLAIPPNDLHDEIRRLVREVYVGRERMRIELEIETALRHFAPAGKPAAEIDLLGMLEFLHGHLHDLLPRLAVDALERIERDHIIAAIEAAASAVVARLNEREAEAGKRKTDAETEQAVANRSAELVRQARVVAESALAQDRKAAVSVDPVGLVQALEKQAPVAVMGLAMHRARELAGEDLRAGLIALLDEEPGPGETAVGHREFRHLERYWLLSAVDKNWMQHLLNMDELRDGIHLRGHAQRDPLIEYQKEASELFNHLLAQIALRTTQKAFSATESVEQDAVIVRDLREQATEGLGAIGPAAPGGAKSAPKVGRNDPCPCGSGKKYKLCCMK